MADIHPFPAQLTPGGREAARRLREEVERTEAVATQAVSDAVIRVAGNASHEVALKAVAKAAVIGLVLTSGLDPAKRYIGALLNFIERPDGGPGVA